MATRKTRWRLGIDHFDIGVFGNPEIFVAAAVGEVDVQRLVLEVEIEDWRNRGGLHVFGFRLVEGFGCDAYQEVIGFDEVLAFFFGGMAFVGIGNRIRMDIFHAVAVNRLEFF